MRSRAPRVALVHDFLSQRGGAERVALHLASVFPGAPLYTSFYDADRTFPQFRALDVRTSSLQGTLRPDSFRRQVLRFPSAFRRLDLSEFDAVVVSSSAFAHHVDHPNVHVYCHTPPRFLYDLSAYLGRRFGAASLAPVVTPAMLPLRRADRAAARRAIGYAANSAHTRANLARAYGITAPVIHPPIWTEHLPATPTAPRTRRALVISRLLPYKQVDRAVRACALAGVGITVAGDGPERSRLEAIAGPDARFEGSVSDARLAALVEEHAVVVVPGVEDFGLVPCEAQYGGRPVIAPAAGGALETVHHGQNGLLVTTEDDESWATAITDALAASWDPWELRRTTERFSVEHFGRAIRTWAGLDRPLVPAPDAVTVGRASRNPSLDSVLA